tara:strand:+ start:486412 stop:486702 length:291 start_codon:yes stop_codon:yes gene_type:complete
MSPVVLYLHVGHWCFGGLFLLIAVHDPHIVSAVERAVGGVGLGEEAFDFEVGEEDECQDDDDDCQWDKDDESDDDQREKNQQRENASDGSCCIELD